MDFTARRASQLILIILTSIFNRPIAPFNYSMLSIDQQVLRQCADLGFKPVQVVQGVVSKQENQATQAYHLLCSRKVKIASAQKKKKEAASSAAPPSVNAGVAAKVVVVAAAAAAAAAAVAKVVAAAPAAASSGRGVNPNAQSFQFNQTGVNPNAEVFDFKQTDLGKSRTGSNPNAKSFHFESSSANGPCQMNDVLAGTLAAVRLNTAVASYKHREAEQRKIATVTAALVAVRLNTTEAHRRREAEQHHRQVLADQKAAGGLLPPMFFTLQERQRNQDDRAGSNSGKVAGVKFQKRSKETPLLRTRREQFTRRKAEQHHRQVLADQEAALGQVAQDGLSIFEEFLVKTNTKKYREIFEREECTDLATLRLFTEDDFGQLGLAMGARRRVTAFLGTSTEVVPPSFPSSSPEIQTFDTFNQPQLETPTQTEVVPSSSPSTSPEPEMHTFGTFNQSPLEEQLKLELSEPRAAFVFSCTNDTQEECFDLALVGGTASLLRNKSRNAHLIDVGTNIFLFNRQTLTIFGPFLACNKLQNNFDPSAWIGTDGVSKLPAQVAIETAEWEAADRPYAVLKQSSALYNTFRKTARGNWINKEDYLKVMRLLTSPNPTKGSP